MAYLCRWRKATFDVDRTHLNSSGVKKKNIYKDKDSSG